MIYGYARVSSTDQNLDRQLRMLREYISDDRFIITDKASGKDFNRKGYNSLVGTAETAPMLHSGDMLIITSLDRLGRNYKEIRDQWQHITYNLEADIKVLDMPLLDTSKGSDSLDKRFIVDLVLQILSYTAEKERENIRKRQRQGIEATKASGKYLGRPKANFPENWESTYNEWKSGSITAVRAMKNLGLKKTTFYKLVKQYEKSVSR
ncbi:MAG: recombinase family protein [Ruminococcus sp.]|nr:recombinase family protein [Ruminococcus sp.]